MTMLSTLGRGQQRESGIFRIKAAFSSIVISADVSSECCLLGFRNDLQLSLGALGASSHGAGGGALETCSGMRRRR